MLGGRRLLPTLGSGLGIGLSAFCASIVLTNSVTFATPHDESSSLLRELQQKEAQGQAVDRAGQLAGNSNGDRWAAGQVKVNGQWQPVAKLNTSDALLAKYEEQRAKSDDSVDSQLALARWCQRHGLDAQAQAHFYAVLAIEPNHVGARKELQHQWLNDRWFTPREIAAARAQSKQIQQDVDAWTPILKDILRGMQAKDATIKLQSLEKLNAIDKPEAISAMELAVGVIDEQLALPLVKKIAGFRSPEACQALLNFSLRETTSPVAQAAIKELKSLPEALVIPELLSALSMPIEISSNVVGLPNGRLALTTLISRELKDQKLVQRNESQFRIVSQLHSEATAIRENRERVQINTTLDDGTTRTDFRTHVSGASNSGFITAQYVPQELFAAAQTNAREQAETLKQQVAAENDRIQKQVARVCSVLRDITGEDIENSPQPWWDWWSIRNEKYEPKAVKRTVERRSYDEKDLSVASVRSQIVQGNSTSERTVWQHTSCLVAGTQVQTQTGLRPIDQIKVGDLVVSQDVESGELALKPVIRTTRGDTRPIIAIVTEHETIQATPSHFWWVAGHGWKRSNELTGGMQLHTATGTLEVKETRQAEPQPVFNLVVEEYHTYFVGSDRILSYDVMPLKGSLRVVPGFQLSMKP